MRPPYDPISRLTSLSHDLVNTANDVTTTFGYNPYSQIISAVRSNAVYACNSGDSVIPGTA